MRRWIRPISTGSQLLQSPSRGRGRLAAALIAGSLTLVAGCGDVEPAVPTSSASDAARDAREERAALKRAAAAKRQAARAKARRAEARNQGRGDALSQRFVAAGTRDQWSVIGVSVDGGAVTVHTDLQPGNTGAFTGACGQLVGAEPWIATIDVVGTDGQSHASWSRGDAACQAAAS